MWKLSPELEEDVSQLFSAMRRPKLLLGSRTACKIIEDLAAYNEPAVILVIVAGLFSHSKAVHEAASSSIDPDRATSECSKGFLARWFSSSSYNRVFTQPSTEQKSEIQAAIDDSKSKFDNGFLSDLGFWLSCHGFDTC